MYEIVNEFNREKLKIQLIVIAGRNKSLVTRLKRNARKFHFPIRVLGFTDQVHEIMAESDLIITKAGPGTIAEALAMGLPIIVTSWLPGQEEGNVEFVVRENVGRVSKEPARVVEIVRELTQTSEFEELKKNIKRVSRPQAAMEIAREIFRYL
jgi:1,2-diacylglycerol 3-beta-galactosyltransferase